APSGIRILSPVAGGACHGEVTIRIEVHGLLRAAATTDDDSPSSVHVFLNQRALPLPGFMVADIGAPAPAAGAIPPGADQEIHRFDPLSDLSLKPHPAAKQHGKATGRDIPRGGLRPLASVLVQGPSQQAGRFGFTRAGAEALASRLGSRAQA